MFVGLCESPLEDELDDLVVKLSAAVCKDIWWWGDAKPLHICIRKVVWKLGNLVVR